MEVSLKHVLHTFLENAQICPQQVALEFDEQIWTYDELLTNMIRIAHHLNVKQGDIVYQYVDSSLEMVCGILAILYSGGTYCPLDTKASPGLIKQLMDSIQGKHALIHHNTQEKFMKIVTDEISIINIESILLHDETRNVLVQSSLIETRSPSTVIEQNIDTPCFIVSTFHSKDQPSIIVHTHRSVSVGIENMFLSNRATRDIVLLVTPPPWSIHLFEILMPFVATYPGTLILTHVKEKSTLPDWCEMIQNKHITSLFMNCMLLAGLTNSLNETNGNILHALQHVRLMWTTGDPEVAQQLSIIKRFLPSIHTYFIFGMNETNAALGYEVEQFYDTRENPMGYPLKHYQSLLIDEKNDREVIPITNTQTIGHLYLSGRFCYVHYQNVFLFGYL